MTGPSWSRYGSHYRRLCARAGCNAPAVATLRFLPTEREAWLAELDAATPRSQGDLCQRHAAALVLPRGWELHDERAAARPAPADPEPASGNGNGRGNGTHRDARRGRERRADDPGNGMRSVPAQFGSSDDDAVDEELGTILDARTPLLRRAFRNTKPVQETTAPRPGDAERGVER